MEIEPLLMSFLEISSIRINKDFENIPLDEEAKICWILHGDSGTNIVLENISNDWIKITFSTIIKKEGWGNSHAKSNPSDNSMLVPIARIKNFIKKVTQHFIDNKNEEFQLQTDNYLEYKNIVEKILKATPDKLPKKIEIDKEFSKIPTLVIHDNEVNHVINFTLPKTESLLDNIEINANFVVKKQGGKEYFARPFSYLIPLAYIEEYPLITSLFSDLKRKKYQTLDNIVENMRKTSQDTKLLSLINFLEISESLPEQEESKTPVKKI